MALAAGLARGGIALGTAGHAAQAGRRTTAGARRRVVAAAFGLSPGTGPGAAELVGSAVDDVDALDGYAARFLPARGAAAIAPLIVLAAIALASPVSAVILLVTLIPFIVAIMVPIFRGNIIRSVIGGAIVIAAGLFIATATAPQFTQIAIDSGFTDTQGSQFISSLVDGANPVTGLFFGVANLGGWALAVLAVLALGFAFWVSRIEKRRDLVRDAEAAAAGDSSATIRASEAAPVETAPESASKK